jgi:hypothetical protein
MASPDWVNIDTPREGQQMMASTFGTAEAIVSATGYTMPYTPVAMVRNGSVVPATAVTSDGSGFYVTEYDTFTVGTHVLSVEAGTPPDIVRAPAHVFQVIPGVDSTFIDLNAPTDGSVYQAATDGFAYVDFNGRTDPNMRVTIWAQGVFTGRVGYADASGNFNIRLMPLPVGSYSVAAAAGWTGGSPIAQISLSVMGPPTRPPRPPLLPLQTFTWYMNWLADTIIDGRPQYSATSAARIAAGAPYGSTLRRSLNIYAGHAGPDYETSTAVLNELAGTVGFSNVEAVYEICKIIEQGGTIP